MPILSKWAYLLEPSGSTGRALHVAEARKQVHEDPRPLVDDDAHFAAMPREHEPPGESVHGERANFTGRVLFCIEADFCK